MSKIPRAEWSAISMRYARGETIAKIAQDYGCTAPAIHYILKRYKQRAGPIPPQADAQLRRATAGGGRRPQAALDEATLRQVRAPLIGRPTEIDKLVGGSPATGRGQPPRVPALTADLNTQLHHDAEAVIGEFRLSFNAALADGSAETRARLRQAASNLMRIGARTTIVLDRLGARETAARSGRDEPSSPPMRAASRPPDNVPS